MKQKRSIWRLVWMLTALASLVSGIALVRVLLDPPASNSRNIDTSLFFLMATAVCAPVAMFALVMDLVTRQKPPQPPSENATHAVSKK